MLLLEPANKYTTSLSFCSVSFGRKSHSLSLYVSLRGKIEREREALFGPYKALNWIIHTSHEKLSQPLQLQLQRELVRLSFCPANVIVMLQMFEGHAKLTHCNVRIGWRRGRTRQIYVHRTNEN